MNTNILDYLDAAAKKYGDKPLIFCEEKQATIAEVQRDAKTIGSAIAKNGFRKQPILLLMDKSIELFTAMMGVIYSGNFYVVIDTQMPSSRLDKILDILQPAMIVRDLENLSGTPIDDSLLHSIRRNAIDTDLLYVLFTSGSTGSPKGVSITHRSVIDYTEWVVKTFQIDDNSVLGNQAPFYFDNSVLDIFCTIKAAAALHIIPPKLFSNPKKLITYLLEKNINTIFWVPAALNLIANMHILTPNCLPELKKILFAGEVMPNKQLNIWRKNLPNALYANLYGPTEITVDSTYYIVDREFADDEPLPIGIPCENTDVLVLNDQNQLVQGHEIGELCVRGTSLAAGYYNNTEKTKEAFVQNPLNPHYPELIYRTGDLVHYNERGEIMYDSRKDFQIKHMGYRIELGEIETAASALSGIDSCCCLYNKEKLSIILFYQGEDIPSLMLANELKKSLPQYMVPHKYIKMDTLPLNANGKIDRVKLRETL
jgi:amino acid adenylation domain-containing protein